MCVCVCAVKKKVLPSGIRLCEGVPELKGEKVKRPFKITVFLVFCLRDVVTMYEFPL